MKRLLIVFCMVMISACSTHRPQEVHTPLKQNTGFDAACIGTPYPTPEWTLAQKSLNLNVEQKSASQALIQQRESDASPLADKLERKQAALDHLFNSATLNDDTLALLLTEISLLQTKLQYLYLGACIKQYDALTETQRRLVMP
jgi:Spy/CpxP family protein refolding chaperone